MTRSVKKEPQNSIFLFNVRYVTLGVILFRTVENLGIGGVEGAVHYDGQDDRERHQQHDGDGGLAEKQAEEGTDYGRQSNAYDDPAQCIG